MDQILSNIGTDVHSLASTLCASARTESFNLDEKLAHVCSLLPKREDFANDKHDAYILWLRETTITTQETINGIDVRMFHSNEALIDVILNIPTSNVFLIIDKALVQSLLPFLEHLAQILFVYILTNEESKHDVLVIDSSAVICKIFDDQNALFSSLIEDMNVCTNDSISTTIFDLNTEEESTNQTTNISSVWYRLLMESLLSLTVYKETAKSDLITYCRQQYSIDNNEQQKLITEFENDYSSTNAIRWYTRNSFIYRLLNKALRSRTIADIFKFRFFLIDLQKQLEYNFNESFVELFPRLYRGQQISPLELDKLQKSKGKYICINSYLSTSMDKNVALAYATGESAILLEIDVDLAVYINNRRVCPIYVQSLSYFPDEHEVIFPFGSIFRVNSVEKEDGRWHIILQSTNDDDNDKLRHYIEQNYTSNFPSTAKFADLLIRIGDLNNAERMVQLLIEDLQFADDHCTMRYAYDLMGLICYHRSDYESALSWFEKALDSIQSVETYHETIYLHIGDVYYCRGEMNIALEYYNKALQYKDHMDSFHLANLYEQFGNIYCDMGNLDDALLYLDKTLNIRRSFISSHINYAETYSAIASIFSARKDHYKALQFEKQALNIVAQIVPKTHPALVTAYTRVGMSYSRCDNVKFAIIYCRKARNITRDIWRQEDSNQHFSPTNYMFLCGALAYLNARNGNISKVLRYINEAIDVSMRFDTIFEKSYPILRNIYSYLATSSLLIGDFTSALQYLKRAFQLAKDPSKQIETLSEIVSVHLRGRQTTTVVSSIGDLLAVSFKLNRSVVDLEILATIMQQIGSAYQLENNLEKATFFAETELQLRSDDPNPNFERIASVYERIADLCPDKRAMYYKKANDIILDKVLPIATNKWECHRRIGLYFMQREEDWPQALFHFQAALDHLLQTSAPCYLNLIQIYTLISILYDALEIDNIDAKLFYSNIGYTICCQLLAKKQIPANDKVSFQFMEKRVVDEFQQCACLVNSVLTSYSQLRSICWEKGDRKQALELCRKQEDLLNGYAGEREPIELGSNYFSMGLSFVNTEIFDRAIPYFEKSVECKLEDYNKYHMRYFLIGTCYNRLEDYTMAMTKYKIALTFGHNAKSIDHKMLSLTYDLIGVACKKMNNHQHAIIYFQQAAKHQLLCNLIDYKMIAVSNINCAQCAYSLKPWAPTEAVNYALIGMTVGENLFTESELDDYNCIIGIFYLRNNEYASALEYFNIAIEHTAEAHNVYKWLQRLNVITGDFNKAYEYAKRNIDNQLHTTTTLNFNDLSDAYIGIGTLHFRLGQYKSALKWYKRSFYLQEVFQRPM